MRPTSLFILTVVISLASMIPTALAEETPVAAHVAGKPVGAEYPFIARITGTNVNVRSGNSQTEYACAQLDAPATVTVVDEVFGWAKVLPPEGTYSWIYKAYVDVDESDPTVGVVTGDNVNVWAGADDIDSGNSSGLQTKLNSGEVVELYAEQPETGDYYRVKPPTGAHLWIHTDYLQYVGPVQQNQPIVVPPRPQTTDTQTTTDTEQGNVPIPSESEQGRPEFTNLEGQQEQPQTTESVDVQPEQQQPADQTQTQQTQPVTPKLTQKESQLLQQCYDLAAKVDAEWKKPLGEQDYSAIKEQLKAIQEDPDAGKAAAYAQLLSDRIQRAELAQSVTEIVRRQERQLERTRQRIEQARQDQLSQMPDEVQYMYTGTLKPSHVYTDKAGPKRYLLVDDRGKIQCYLTAAGPAMQALLGTNVDQIVGVNGNIVSDERSLVTVVAVNELQPLEE